MKESTLNATQMVRNYAAANGIIRKKDVRIALNLSIDQTAYAFDTLKRQGYISQIKHGMYKFCEAVEKPGADINDKIWKAMKVSGTFTMHDIAKLAESTVNYVYKRFRFFRAQGYIQQYGVKRTGRTSQMKLWRLTLSGKEKALAPNEEEFTPDPFVMAAVNLNRLICSGVAIRDHEAGKQALEFCDQIRKGLEDAATS
ncbi:MAG: hypothetical protein KKE62_01850 [Proteobacteria bacterium]|nr:hypothetical protein [Pseudomonadota bacterium]MBU1387118.1 hypothetical protein [Pseudomonadota bacterium]MBU1541565.1 hypothetical protein [Pseudomonadota bacterium]MBU2429090.1 hypothetical protein [Pseudomonadota bacterium]MBU2482765.1 hypothetical protein [Pseudomonadota bacterium]